MAVLALLTVTSQLAAADQAADFGAAVARWRSLGVTNYSFHYRLGGADLIAPWCSDADIEVKVESGVGGVPVVVRGNARCPAGTRGHKIGFKVPRTIDAAFDEIRRYLYNPPTPVEITVTYDAKYGVPLKYYVTKLEISDSDEGFEISGFRVKR
jgi:hypothetical protein